MVNAAARPPVENWTDGSSGIPLSGLKRRIMRPVIATGYGSDKVKSTAGCWSALTVAGTLSSESAGADGSATTSECTRDAVTRAESAASTVKLNVPAAAGVPLTTPPEAFSVRPSGSAPADIRNAYGAVPPVTVIVKLYGAPATAPGREAALVNAMPGAIVMPNVFCAVRLAASVSVTVKLKLPVAAGVPASTPVGASSVRPGGIVPLEIVNTYGGVPPEPASVVV